MVGLPINTACSIDSSVLNLRCHFQFQKQHAWARPLPAYNRGLKSRSCCAAPVEYDYMFSENGLVAYKDGKVRILAALSVHLAPNQHTQFPSRDSSSGRCAWRSYGSYACASLDGVAATC